MPLALTHFIVTVVILTLLRDYFSKKHYFPIHYVFLGGLAGLLPDIDIAVFWILSFFGYSLIEFSHNLVFLFSFLVISFATKNLKSFNFRNAKIHYHKLFFVIFIGVLIHIILDMFSIGGATLLFPFNNVSFGYNLALLLPEDLQELLFPTIDAILLIFWISYLEWKHKISSFF